METTSQISLKASLEKDIKLTCSNYTNMHARLQLRNNMASVLIVYYSIVTIVFSIIGRYFSISELSNTVLDFSAVLTAIVILVSSLMISMANYSFRIRDAVIAIDSLKKMKKEIQAKAGTMEQDEYDEYIEKYHEIIDKMELRSETDFFRTCFKEKKTKEYFTKIQRFVLACEIIFERCFYLCLIVAPVILIVFVVPL